MKPVLPKSFLPHAAFVAALLILCPPAHAVLIGPGDTQVPLPGTTSAAEPHLAGIVVLVDEIIPFSFFDGGSGGTISGRVQQRLLLAVDGTIDFYWRVFNDETSSGAIGAFRVGEFDAPEYDVNWRIDGLGDRGPDTATRFLSPSSYVNFNFFLQSPVSGLLPGEESFFFFFDTTATHYAKTAIFDLAATQGISATFDAYEPAAIPEPATFGLLGAGVAVLARLRNRTRRSR
jgi:hypothetical protein